MTDPYTDGAGGNLLYDLLKICFNDFLGDRFEEDQIINKSNETFQWAYKRFFDTYEKKGDRPEKTCVIPNETLSERMLLCVIPNEILSERMLLLMISPQVSGWRMLLREVSVKTTSESMLSCEVSIKTSGKSIRLSVI